MNKAQFVEAIALDANISKIDARKAVDAMIRVTVQSLREGERLTLTGLGTFSVQQKSERVGRNPRTGAAVKIPPRKVIKFRPTADCTVTRIMASTDLRASIFEMFASRAMASTNCALFMVSCVKKLTSRS
jgi:DNA-binding protein HU-beta